VLQDNASLKNQLNAALAALDEKRQPPQESSMMTPPSKVCGLSSPLSGSKFHTMPEATSKHFMSLIGNSGDVSSTPKRSSPNSDASTPTEQDNPRGCVEQKNIVNML
jgi:hypothetical protein